MWRYVQAVTRTHEKVRYSPAGKYAEPSTPEEAADRVGEALSPLDGRWKLLILFRLFGGHVLRFSELERAIPGISQKMLSQQLRQMERDGLVRRIPYAEVPPRVEYELTEWGQASCPVLDSLLRWAAARTPVQEAET
jgi:DNA-binding HxlR family transcriptional regulator